LKKANEIIFFQTSILKSRKFHCINEIKEENKKDEVLITACKNLVKDKACFYFENLKKFETNSKIEYSLDLKKYKETKICPYYGEIFKIKNANLIICNYNYLLQCNSLKIFQDIIHNPFIIIDEAHNFLDSLENNYNNKIDIEFLLNLLNDLNILHENIYRKKIKKEEQNMITLDFTKSENMENINVIYRFLLIFLKNLIYLNQRRSQIEKEKQVEYRGYFIFYLFFLLFSKNELNESILSEKIIFIKNDFDNNFYENEELKDCFYQDIIIPFLKNENNHLIIDIKSQKIICNILDKLSNKQFKFGLNNQTRFQKLKKNFIHFFFQILFSNFYRNVYGFKNKNAYIDDYYLILNDKIINDLDEDDKNTLFVNLNYLAKIIISANDIQTKKFFQNNYRLFEFLKSKIKSIKEKNLSLICLNPSIGFKRLNTIFGQKTVINLMSGTLKPFDYYEFQLRTEFPLKLETNHIIKEENINFIYFTEPIITKNDYSENIFRDEIILGKLSNKFNQNNEIMNLDSIISLNNSKYCNNIKSYDLLTNLRFSSSNNNNKEKILMTNIIKIIFDFSHTCLSGNLVFFKSYEMIKKFNNHLKGSLNSKNIHYDDLHTGMIIKINLLDIYPELDNDNNISSSYLGKKRIKIEKEDNYLNFFFDLHFSSLKIKNDTINLYKEYCSENQNKNFFFTVMRGSLSEGVNFKNQECTSLFIFGLPFALFVDPTVILKMKYLNQKYNEIEKIEFKSSNIIGKN